MQFVDKNIAILGLGEEGQDVLTWLKSNSLNCRIKVFDKITTVDLSGFDIVFRSPGFWRLSLMLKKAAAAGVMITSATKLFFNLCPCPIIGVTGTKGKGTTASLITRILTKSGQSVYLAGNIGKPMLQLLSKLKVTDLVCLELSSFQLQDLTKSPHIAVVLNITSEHLDVHQTTAEYRQAKANILKHQTSSDHAIINSDYQTTKSMTALTKAKVSFFSRHDLSLDHRRIQLRGEHNLENIAAAIAVAKLVGVNNKIIMPAVYSFKGLEHRLELVREVKGVKYYNDSFSTTPETAIAAIKSFKEPEILILGGSDKGSDYTKLGQTISSRRNLKAIILIGKMGPVIRRSIHNFSGQIIFNGKTMIQIIKQAKLLAKSGDVVVLSPACASFDMFLNYKDRGNQFKAYVKKLH
ncbi:UDP-N-acetylmuramoyl-L-alanine--D-glutamate ligase [Patescibacteria group bacterium]|nr:UDP-N-acetylmuramoyl-L-alanine--D-glutamate ligase [Patescibacteria group bacterium]MBU1500185.1 UDP-N-acetylmuramoyl-L-alanine--D-glutamate ligase [Patescibacteria group bacterium]